MKQFIYASLTVCCFFLFFQTNLAQPMPILDTTSTITRVLVNSVLPGTEAYEFSLHLVDTTFTKYTTFRFTWYFGDGEYAEYRESFPQGAPVITRIRHEYRREVNQLVYSANDVYVEVTGGNYDDLDPPERASYQTHGPALGVPFSTACQNCNSSSQNIVHTQLSLTTNRNLVPGHHVTYILTVANNCLIDGSPPVDVQVNFQFDADQLLPENVSMPGIALLGTSVGANAQNQYSWQMNDLHPGEVRRIFIRMKVKQSMNYGDRVNVLADLGFLNSVICPSAALPVSNTNSIDNSHDPNLLTSDMLNGCPNNRTDSMRYTIQFKNDGNGAADSVIIKTVIPDVFELGSIRVIYPNPSGLILSTTTDPITREARWTLSGPFLKNNHLLRGGREPGFGQSFFVDDTVDSLVFEVDFLPSYEPYPCEAIINQAEIIFDCNPSIFTGPFIYRFGCVNSAVPPSSPCIPCDEGQNYEVPPEIYRASDGPLHLENYGTSTYPPTASEYWWFPSPSLSPDARIRYPYAAPKKATDYFVVVTPTAACYRLIFRYPVHLECDMDIVATVQLNYLGQKRVVAKVVGNYNPGSIRWNDCEVKDLYTSPWVNDEEMFISVVDMVTNCSVNMLMQLGPF
ncbi:MAG: hypothetical protein AAGD05_07880 [Bacteroidota bacterium]